MLANVRRGARAVGARGRAGSRAAFVLVLAAAGLTPSLAAAQRAVLLPPGGDSALVEAHGAEALSLVAEVLRGASIEVMSIVEARAAAERAGAPACEEPSCAAEMLRAVEATMAAGVALWRRDGGSVQVAIVLADPEGRQASASYETPAGAELSAVALRETVVDAIDAALASWSVRGGAPVRVLGSPEGASITVDRVLWGTIPHEGALPPGEHRFVVSAAGHESERRTVPIRVRVDGEPEVLRFELAASGGESGGPVGGGGESLAVGLGVGIPLLVLGAAGLVTGIVGATGGSSCASADCGRGLPAVEREIERPAGAAITGWIVAGSVALVGGVVAIVLGVIGADGGGSGVRAGRDGLQLDF